jgi:arginine deiminase
VPYSAVEALRAHGYIVLFLPEAGGEEALRRMALNFVTLGPRRILMAGGSGITQRFFESAGISCHTVAVNELVKAAGGIGCLSGVLARDPTA